MAQRWHEIECAAEVVLMAHIRLASWRSWRHQLAGLLAGASVSVGLITGVGAAPAHAVLCDNRGTGTSLRIPGYESRPTFLQRSTDSSAPLLVMFHGMDACVSYLQRQTKLTPTSGRASVNLLWLSGTPSRPGSATRNWDTWSSPSAKLATYRYIARSLDAARAKGVTAKTVVAVGISQGGYMAQRAICDKLALGNGVTYDGAAVFKGVVSVVGPDRFRCARSTGRSLLVVETSGDGPYGTGGARGGAKAENLRNQWLATQTTCPGAAFEASAGSGAYKVLAMTWVGCKNGTIVKSVVAGGFGHVWPLPAAGKPYDVNVDTVSFARRL